MSVVTQEDCRKSIKYERVIDDIIQALDSRNDASMVVSVSFKLVHRTTKQ